MRENIAKFFCATIIYPLFVCFHLGAEVEEVRIKWDNIACNIQCAEQLKKQFSKMKELEQYQVNPAVGEAVLKWKPGTPFSYRPIKTSFQMVGVGIGINNIRVRVRGKAGEVGDQVVLYSHGDNTPFQLVSPIMPDPARQVVYPNPIFRTLDPKLREGILREAEEGKTIVIEGPLYQPARSPPLQIVIERILVEKKEQAGNQR